MEDWRREGQPFAGKIQYQSLESFKEFRSAHRNERTGKVTD
jgi:hypothetical protein